VELAELAELAELEKLEELEELEELEPSSNGDTEVEPNVGGWYVRGTIALEGDWTLALLWG
jgi:hypothetical protein